MFCQILANWRGCALIEALSLAGRRGSFEAAAGEVEDGVDVFEGEALVESYDFGDGQSVVHVFKDDRNGDSRSPKYPGTAQLTRDAFHRFTLCPIESHKSQCRNAVVWCQSL